MKVLPILSSTALLLAPFAVAAPAAADQPTVSNVTTTSTSSVVYSMMTISGNWHVDNPSAGDAFTVELGRGLVWPTGTVFPLTERTTGTTVATCTATAGTTTLTCVFNDAAEQWDTLDGTFQARAQINAAAIGTSTSTIVVAGASIPVNFGGTIVGQGADPTTYKGGWYAGDTKDGLHRFDWYINVSGATDYAVSDPGATVRSAQCTDAAWSDAYAVKYAVNGDVTVFSAPHTTSVCRVKVETVTADVTTSNTATVNGTAYTGRARVSANGSGEGDGSNAPTPAPTPTAEAPTPEPSEEPTPEETTPAPAPAPTTPPTTETHSWPTPSSSPSPSSVSPAPSQQPSPSPSAQSSTTASAKPTVASTPSSKPSSTTPKHTATSPNMPSKSPAASNSPAGTASPSAASTTTPTTERSLAHTGTSAPWFVAFAVVLIGVGAAATIHTRKH